MADADIGTHFDSSGPAPPVDSFPVDGEKAEIKWSDPVGWLGDRPIRAGKWPFYLNPTVRLSGDHERGATVVLARPCLTLKMSLGTPRFLTKTGFVSLKGPPTSGFHDIVRAGATAYWPDGTVAGVTGDDFEIDEEEPPRDGRRCFENPVVSAGADTDGSAVLCFDPADITTGAGGTLLKRGR